MKTRQTLHLQASTTALPEVIAFIEAITSEQSLPRNISLKMQLAAEEVIAALTPGVSVEIGFSGRADRITLGVTCHPLGMDLSAFNLAWRPDLETDASGLGLAVASRWVDTFSLQTDESGRLRLQFSIDNVYDAAVPVPLAFPEFRFYRLVKPTTENIKHCGARLFHRAAGAGKPPRIYHPDRLATLLAAGHLFGTLAETESGEIAGACFCIPEGPKLLGGHGPFVFSSTERERMARDLACHTLERVARKPFSGVLATHYDADCFPAEYFIPAGRESRGSTIGHHHSPRAPAWHFPLSDDAGGLLHFHASAEDFIREAIAVQDLPRTLVDISGEHVAEDQKNPSVYSATLNRGEKMATLRLLMPGGDIEENTDAHLAFFRDEDISLCQVHLDLGRPADAALIPVLMNRQFTPCLLIPGGAEGDLMVLESMLQRSGGAA